MQNSSVNQCTVAVLQDTDQTCDELHNHENRKSTKEFFGDRYFDEGTGKLQNFPSYKIDMVDMWFGLCLWLRK
jgi:hypothetical protein